MIVKYTEQGWSIIMQRSHGLLAAQICGHWKKDNQPKRWIETLIATAEHDDGKDELDKTDLIQENGGPKNFKMNPFEKKYCDELLNRALSKGRYIGILTSMHIRFIYGDDGAAKKYVKSLLKTEKSWIKQTETTQKEVSASYSLLEFCDAFSLLLCQGLVQPENRKMEISNGPDGIAYQLHISENDELIVDPWPFEENSFKVNYESRCIQQLVFTSDADLKMQLQSAPIETHVLVIAKSPIL